MVISRITMVITYIRGLITPTTAHEPPSTLTRRLLSQRVILRIAWSKAFLPLLLICVLGPRIL